MNIKNYIHIRTVFRQFSSGAAVFLLNTLLGLLFFCLPARAQNYPVQVIPQLLPPYSLTLSDYYTGTREKLIVTLTSRDLQKPLLKVRLRMTVESQGVVLRSREDVFYPEINLEAGIPLRLSLNDLAPYFNINNLDMQGFTRAQYQQGAKLPEGFYKFGFEVIEINTRQVISQKNQAMAWLSLSDPPLLNLPLKGTLIEFREPQNIIFQWTPRHLSSPNSAFNSEYEFTLTEIWDNGISPEAAFSSAPPLYQTTTATTTLLYGPGEPALIPGRKYAWRVRAKAKNGADELDLFRNQGYSEISWFSQGLDCRIPQNIQVSFNGSTPTIRWDADFNKLDYVVEYRQKGNDRAAWFSQKTTENSMPLYDLKAGYSYEYRIGGACQPGVYTYSEVKSFKVEPATYAQGTENCGLEPKISITNKTPIQNLAPGDVILAGDFPVKLTEVNGSGTFRGKGYITVPFIGQLQVAVGFEGIRVNTDRQLIAGSVITLYDGQESQVVRGDSVQAQVKVLTGLVNDVVNKLYEDLKTAVTDEVMAGRLVDLWEEMLNNPDIQIPDSVREAFKENKGEIRDYARTVVKDVREKISSGEKDEDIKKYLVSNLVEKQTGLTSEATSQTLLLQERLAKSIDYDKLIKWLIANRGKLVDYDFRAFQGPADTVPSSEGIISVPVDKTFTATIDGISREFALRGSLSTQKGKVNLDVKTGRISAGVNILPGADKIQFTLNYLFADNNETAIILATHATEEMEYLFVGQQIVYTNWYKDQIRNKFKDAFTAAGDDANRLDYLYENLPSFVTITDEQRWEHLQLLSKKWIDGVGTDEEKAVINLIGKISPGYLGEKIDADPGFFMDLYRRLGSQAKVRFTSTVTTLLDNTWTAVSDLKTVYPEATSLGATGTSETYIVSCFGISNNTLNFGSSIWNEAKNGTDLRLVRLIDDKDCGNRFTVPASSPLILKAGTEKIVIPAFIAGQILSTAITESYDKLLSLNVGLLMPEMLIKSGNLGRWSTLLKEEGRVKDIEKVAIDVAAASEKQLDDVFERLSVQPPFKYQPNTIEHKAERWAQYKARLGDEAKDYSRWSNIYNTNMVKATKANEASDEIMLSIGWGRREVTVQAGSYKRRLDIADLTAKRGVEVKSYETGKVYATQAIKRELSADRYLISNDLWEIEWIFRSCEPSQPLKVLLDDAGIKIILIP